MVGLANVDNTSDANKPISTATQAALEAPIDNPIFIGVVMSTYVSARVLFFKATVRFVRAFRGGKCHRPCLYSSF
mgnify:CR=1 FL=1